MFSNFLQLNFFGNFLSFSAKVRKPNQGRGIAPTTGEEDHRPTGFMKDFRVDLSAHEQSLTIPRRFIPRQQCIEFRNQQLSLWRRQQVLG